MNGRIIPEHKVSSRPLLPLMLNPCMWWTLLKSSYYLLFITTFILLLWLHLCMCGFHFFTRPIWFAVITSFVSIEMSDAWHLSPNLPWSIMLVAMQAQSYHFRYFCQSSFCIWHWFVLWSYSRLLCNNLNYVLHFLCLCYRSPSSSSTILNQHVLWWSFYFMM
jgi:hypothetical protein